MGLYFCHGSVPELDTRTGKVSYLPTCKDQLAQPGGNIDPNELVDLAYHQQAFPEYSALVAHEFQRWSDARLSMGPKGVKEKRIMMGYLVDMTGKTHFDFMLDTQNHQKIEKRIREYAGYLVQCKNYARDPEFDPPRLRYHIIKGPESADPESWDWSPGNGWYETLRTMYNTWEPPFWKSEAQLALEEQGLLSPDQSGNR